MEPPSLYLLLDACVLAGYYAPQTLIDTNPKATERIEILIKSVKCGGAPHVRLLTPEICVAEAQTVLSKHAHAGWNRKLKRDNQKAIHKKSYGTLKKQMRKDLHGGRHVESIPLQRYHILARHLVTPVDHALHLPNRKGRKPLPALGSSDQLISGVAVWMNKLLGNDRLCVVSSDYRLCKVLEKCKKTKQAAAEKLGLIDMAEEIGFDWSIDIYPNVLHLNNATDKQLANLLGAWPLPTRKRKDDKRIRRSVTKCDVDYLVELYSALKIGRDRLPYTDKMRKLVSDFNRGTGHQLSESEVWERLLGRLKKGSKGRGE